MTATECCVLLPQEPYYHCLLHPTQRPYSELFESEIPEMYWDSKRKGLFSGASGRSTCGRCCLTALLGHGAFPVLM